MLRERCCRYASQGNSARTRELAWYVPIQGGMLADLLFLVDSRWCGLLTCFDQAQNGSKRFHVCQRNYFEYSHIKSIVVEFICGPRLIVR